MEVMGKFVKQVSFVFFIGLIDINLVLLFEYIKYEDYSFEVFMEISDSMVFNINLEIKIFGYFFKEMKVGMFLFLV